MVRLAVLRLALTTAAPPPEDRPAYPPIGKGDAEVSWLRVIADGAFPTPPDGWDQWPLPRARHLQLRGQRRSRTGLPCRVARGR